MTCLDSMLCLLTFVLKTRFYWAFPFLSNFTSCYWENRRIWYDNQIAMKFAMICSSTFFYLFFVCFLQFFKFFTLFWLNQSVCSFWLCFFTAMSNIAKSRSLLAKYSDIILTKILRKHNTNLDPNHRIKKCLPCYMIDLIMWETVNF